MPVKTYLPPGLPAPIARPLLEVTERVAALRPWERMSDLHLIGLRDETSGELQVASILGALKQVFAVLIYRNEVGLRWIHKMSTIGRATPDHDEGLETMDYLKVEWVRKGELRKTDRETLSCVDYKPKGKGPIWPRFESCSPGWCPWFVTEREAQLLTRHLEVLTPLSALSQYLCLSSSGRGPNRSGRGRVVAKASGTPMVAAGPSACRS